MCWDAVRTTVFPHYPAFVLTKSQYEILPVVQVASVGAAAITFLIVAVNTGLAAVYVARSLMGPSYHSRGSGACHRRRGVPGGWSDWVRQMGAGAGAKPRLALFDIGSRRRGRWQREPAPARVVAACAVIVCAAALGSVSRR